MIGIVDYGAGNIASVSNALAFIGCDASIVSSPGELDRCDGLVFPGVGSFGAMVETLEARSLYDPLKEKISEGTPFLGICLGLQLLFDGSEESPDHKGFGIFKGNAKRFSQGKVPQIGWNSVEPVGGAISGGWAYFVHSYKIDECEHALAHTDYFGAYVSAVKKDNITALQFHPEKSGPYGLSLLRWWTSCLQKE